MFTALFVGALAINFANSLKTCSNCVEITQCPAAMQLVDNHKTTKTKNLLINLLCSTGEIPKICCSDLPQPGQEDNSETHPNINLLPSDCGYVQSSRLLGGYAAALNEFPWLVLISYRVKNGFHFKCTGTLINPRYVLTAAHCIKDKRVVGVRVGAQDTSRSMYECGHGGVCDLHYQDIRVANAVYHESYTNYITASNDIGLLSLETPANFSSDNAAAICLPITKKLREINTDNEYGVAAGWGSMNNLYPNYAQSKVGITIHPSDRCSSYFGRNFNRNDRMKNKLCGKRENNLLCDDISGIPLIIENDYNGTYRYVQLGVMIHGTSCDTISPVLFTDVRKNINWILDTMKP